MAIKTVLWQFMRFSLSAQPKDYRLKIYKEFAELGIAVVVCPFGRALSMRQLDQ